MPLREKCCYGDRRGNSTHRELSCSGSRTVLVFLSKKQRNFYHIDQWMICDLMRIICFIDLAMAIDNLRPDYCTIDLELEANRRCQQPKTLVVSYCKIIPNVKPAVREGH